MPLGHMGINVRDLVRARVYFDELMPLLGFEPFIVDADQFSYRPVGEQPWPALFFYPALVEGEYSRGRSWVESSRLHRRRSRDRTCCA